MENKIINITKATEEYQCLICCNHKPAEFKIVIQRPEEEDIVTSFHVCNKCLSKMQRDIEVCE